MSFLFNAYINLLKRHTLLTQMGTGGFTSGLGDLICQQGIEKRGWKDHEMYRTRRLMVYGCFCFAPFANRWMAVLNKINVGGKATTVAARVATDMVIFAPFATSLFYTCQGVMESRPWKSTKEMQGIQDRIQERLWSTVKAQWCVFPAAQVINLSVIPLYARPPFLNLFAVGWSVFLSGAQNSGRIDLELDPTLLIAAEVME